MKKGVFMTTFTTLFDQGFGQELVSVMPHSKAPGIRREDGQWIGYKWGRRKATRKDCEEWDSNGGNIGLRATNYPGLDVDVLDEGLSEFIADEAKRILGDAPVRVGKPPKKLLPYRLEGASFKKITLRFKDPERVQHVIECLCSGQQYVIQGTHPEGHSYTVEPSFDKCPAESLTPVSGEKMGAFFDHIGPALEAKGCTLGSRTSSSSSDTQVDQDSLKADVGLVRSAVVAIPNDFDSREEYLEVAYAIRGSCADDVEAGKEIWLEWAARWDQGEPDADYDATTYDTLQSPFRIGASYLFEMAHEHGWVGDAQAEFAEAPPQVKASKAFPAGAPEYSDQALTSRVMKVHRHELRYQPQNGQFLVWDGSRWRPDEHNETDAKITDVLRGESARALGTIDKAAKAERLATRCASNAARACVRTLLKSKQEIVLLNDECDVDPWQLNTPGGTVDLKTGLVKASDPRDNHTMSTSVAPAQGEPLRWNSFLDVAAGGDFDLINYLQRLCGYLCTGSVREHAIMFVYGFGGNGKSVFIDAIGEVLGDYSTNAPTKTFMLSHGDGHPTDIAGLVGARAVFAQETAEGRRWDEGLLKIISGGDPISARFMHQNFFTFRPQFKLIFSGNHKPEIGNLDAAMKRRLSLIPFNCVPKVVDPQLPEKLRVEYPQILHWMIEGCSLWLKEGLNPPEKVRQATEEYFEEEDSIGRWIVDHCRRDPLVITELQMLYSDFSTWAKFNGIRPGSDKRLSRGLVNRGFGNSKHSRTRRSVIEGLRLLNETEKATDEFGRDSDLPYDA